MTQRKRVIQKANQSDKSEDIQNCRLKMAQKNQLNSILKKMGSGIHERKCDPYIPSLCGTSHFFSTYSPDDIESQITMHLQTVCNVLPSSLDDEKYELDFELDLATLMKITQENLNREDTFIDREEHFDTCLGDPEDAEQIKKPQFCFSFQDTKVVIRVHMLQVNEKINCVEF